MKVWIVIEDVRYEGEEIKSVHFEQHAAETEAERLMQAGPHNVARGISYRVDAHEVQG